MTDPLDLVAHTAQQLAEGEATIVELRRDRDRAIYQAIDANRYQSLIAERAGVSPQYVSKLARHRDKYEPPAEPNDSDQDSHWISFYAEFVDEDMPLEYWNKELEPFSAAELRGILHQVKDIRPEDRAWVEAQLRSTA